MKKTSLGRKSSTRFGVDRKSGIPVRAQSSDRLSCGGGPSSDPFFTGQAASSSSSSRSQSIGNLNRLFLPTPGRVGGHSTAGTERPVRSMAQSSSGMSIRSSGATSSIGASKRRDNRELNDKTWQIMAMGLIEDTIKSHEGGHDILNRPQPLKPLSIATFTECCNFLFKLIDPSIEINKTNLVNQLMFLSKKLMYRGKVEKSWIISVNTPHAFPYAIGFLHFLTTVVRCKTLANPLDIMYPTSFDDKEVDSDGGIDWDFKKLLSCFKQISEIRGRDNFEVHRNRIQDRVIQEHIEADKYLSMRSDIHSQSKKLSEDKERLQRELDEKSETVSNIELEYEKNQKLMSDIQNHLKRSQLSAQEKEKHIKELESNLASMKEEIRRRESLKMEIDEKIGAQNFSRHDLEVAQQEITRLMNEIESQKKYKEGFGDLLYRVDLELCKLTQELEESVRNFNLKVKDFATIDPEIETAAIPRSSFQKDDFVKSAQIISGLIQKYKELDLKLTVEITDASSKNKELNDKYDELMKEKTALESKLSSLRAHYETMSREINKQLDDVEKEKQQINSDLKTEVSDDNLPTDLEAAKIKLAETEKKLAENKETADDYLNHQKKCVEELLDKLRALGIPIPNEV